MDTSQQYIEMCKAAYEIQELKKLSTSIGDCYSNGEPDKYLVVDPFNDVSNWDIWLPRQDQLSEMIETWNKKYSITFFQNIVSNSQYRGIPSKGFDSIEKHLLCFVMKENYNKYWDNENKQWLDTNAKFDLNQAINNTVGNANAKLNIEGDIEARIVTAVDKFLESMNEPDRLFISSNDYIKLDLCITEKIRLKHLPPIKDLSSMTVLGIPLEIVRLAKGDVSYIGSSATDYKVEI